MIKEPLERKDLKKEDTWDLSSLFKSIEDWEKEYKEVKLLGESFIKYKDDFTKNAKNFLEVLKKKDELLRRLENVYVYSHLKLDENTRDTKYQSIHDRAQALYIEISDKLSFVLPEILTLDESILSKFIKENQDLKIYEKFLEDILRQRKHLLSPREESILAQMGEVGNSPEKTFSMLNNAD